MRVHFSVKLLTFLLFILSSSVTFAFTLSSPAFHDNGFIPQEYTCHGSNTNPQLNWVGAPQNTQSFALVLTDPDSPKGIWDHWIIYNIPSKLHEIAAGVQSLPAGSIVLKNSWGNTKFDGPCPPSRIHHYWFTLYALSSTINLAPSATKSDLEAAMQNNIVGVAKLMGKVSK